MKYALDANIIIHLIRGTKIAEENIEKAKSRKAKFIIPYAVHYEIRRGLMIKKFRSMKRHMILFAPTVPLKV
ncbi:MAG: hypothetical protein FWG31_04175 [Oscillospiraceae bacterium]|nr:hypothetical protein [Oscillospiraceae bacterium]